MTPRDYDDHIKRLDELTERLLKQYRQQIKPLQKDTLAQLKDVEEERDVKLMKRLLEGWNVDLTDINTLLIQEYEAMIFTLFDAVYQSVRAEFTSLPQKNERLFQRLLEHQFMGKTFSDRIWESKDTLLNELDTTFKDYMKRGKSFSETTKAMRETLQTSDYNINRVVRTEGMRLLNNTKIESYKEIGVERVEWYAAEDERMCKICGELHEKIFDIDRVPNSHPNCRCSVIPIID